MEDRETPRMRKYGESKTTRIMMATVPHVTSGSGLWKFQTDGFLLDRVYLRYIGLFSGTCLLAADRRSRDRNHKHKTDTYCQSLTLSIMRSSRAATRRQLSWSVIVEWISVCSFHTVRLWTELFTVPPKGLCSNVFTFSHQLQNL